MSGEINRDTEHVELASREPVLEDDNRKVLVVYLDHGSLAGPMSEAARQNFITDVVGGFGDSGCDFILPDSFGPVYVNQRFRNYVKNPQPGYDQAIFGLAVQNDAMIVPCDFRLDCLLFPHLKELFEKNTQTVHTEVANKPQMTPSELQREIERLVATDPEFRSQYEVWTVLENHVSMLQAATGFAVSTLGLAAPWVVHSIAKRALETIKHSARLDSSQEGKTRREFIVLSLQSIIASIVAGKVSSDQVSAFIHDHKKAFLARYGLTSEPIVFQDVALLSTDIRQLLASPVELTDAIRARRGYTFYQEIHDAEAKLDFTNSVAINCVFAEAVNALPRRADGNSNGGLRPIPDMERVLVAFGYGHATTWTYKLSDLMRNDTFRYQTMKASFEVMVRAIKKFFPDRTAQEQALAEFKTVLKTPIVPFKVILDGGKPIKQPGSVIPLPRVVELADGLAL